MGDGLFLCAQNACDLAQTSKDAHHVRPLSLFAQSALSRRKRVHFLRRGAALRIANGAFRYRDSYSLDGSLYPPGRKTISARVRCGVAELHAASAPMALSQLIPT